MYNYMFRTIIFLTWLSIIVVSNPVVLSAAENTKKLNTYSDWVVFKDNEFCWAVSLPVSSQASRNGKPFDLTNKRYDVLLYVLFKPKLDNKLAVMFTPGFPPQKVEFIAGSRSQSFSIDGEWASAPSSEAIPLAKRIMADSKLTIASESKGGVSAEDTFSLRGSKAAINEAGKACGIKTNFLNN